MKGNIIIMTDFNNNKYVPKAPKAFQVVELKGPQIKKSNLSATAKSKIINRSGGNYVSENREGYGPMETKNQKMVNKGCAQEARYSVCTALTGDYVLADEDGKVFVPHFVDSGRVKNQDFSRIQQRISQLKNGKVKVWKGKGTDPNTSRERTEECIKYEGYFEASLENALKELKNHPHYGSSLEYYFKKP